VAALLVDATPYAVARSYTTLLDTTPAASADDEPSLHAAGHDAGRGPPSGFPRSLSNRSTGEVPRYAPAALPRLRRRPSPWSPGRRSDPPQEFPAATSPRGQTADQPISARLELVGALERRSGAGSSRTPSRHACRARTIWQYWPVSSLSGLLAALLSRPGDQGCPQLHRAAATTTAAKVTHLHSVPQRLVALQVGHQQLLGVSARNPRSTRSGAPRTAGRPGW
jgi:hypothetical protein